MGIHAKALIEMNEPTLFDAFEPVSIRLTPEQAEILQPLLVAHRNQQKSCIMSLASLSYEPDAGGSVAKLEAVWVPWKTAQKVCGILRESRL